MGLKAPSFPFLSRITHWELLLSLSKLRWSHETRALTPVNGHSGSHLNDSLQAALGRAPGGASRNKDDVLGLDMDVRGFGGEHILERQRYLLGTTRSFTDQ